MPNSEIRSSLPAEIRVAAKSSFLPTSRDFEVAQRFVNCQITRQTFPSALVGIEKLSVSTRNHIPLFFRIYSERHLVFFHYFYPNTYFVVFIISTRNHIPLYFSKILLEITSRLCFIISTRNPIRYLFLYFHSNSQPVVFFISTRKQIPMFF